MAGSEKNEQMRGRLLIRGGIVVKFRVRQQHDGFKRQLGLAEVAGQLLLRQAQLVRHRGFGDAGLRENQVETILVIHEEGPLRWAWLCGLFFARIGIDKST